MFRRNDDGEVIDPPVIPEYEAKLQAAHAAADEDRIARINEDYTRAREDEVNYLESREQQREAEARGENVPADSPPPDATASTEEAKRGGIFR